MPAPALSAEICAETIAAWEAAGRDTLLAAAAARVNVHTFKSRLRVARAREEGDLGFGPGGVPSGPARDGEGPYLVKGVSTYFDADGQQRGQWVKTKIDEEQRLKMVLAAIEDRASRITPLPPIPSRSDGWLIPGVDPAAYDRLNLVTLTDCHIGMLAWDKEAGEDWDINIARDAITRTFVGLLRSMPPARTCIVNQLGDFFHFDGLKAVTPAHGNILDADSRYQKMLGVGTDVLEQVVIEALRLHEKVHLICAEGNHDESTSAALRVMMRRLFRDNPRVTVDDSPLPYYAYQHGKTLLGFHHGHLSKMEQLPALFASEPRFRPMWGTSTRTYIHVGHHHCHELIEKAGAEVERHPTLAARDAYAARGGYVADRRAFGITYHTELGEVGRIAATPETYA